MSARWFRFYAEAMRNPKVGRLSDADFRMWVELLGVAAENDGVIPPLSDLKHVLKRRLDHLSKGLQRLISVGLIDLLEVGYEPHNWAKFQYKSDVSTARVRKHRSARNVSETPPDTDTDTDTEETTSLTPVVPKKSSAFPKPEWADKQVWSDFLTNRKQKGASNTATAHKRLLAAINGLTNDEWPPGRLLEHAVAQGWAAVYPPKEGYPSNGHSHDSLASLRGARPNPALDMVLEAERELQAEAEREASRPDRASRLALPAR